MSEKPKAPYYGTHSKECYKWHHACAIALVERQAAEIERLNGIIEERVIHDHQRIGEMVAMRNALKGAGVMVLGEQEWRWMEEGEVND